MIVHGLIVFVAAIITDITWARWAHHVAEKDPIRSSVWGVGIVFLGAVSIDAIAHSRWYVIPAAIGAAVGTYIAVAHARRSHADSHDAR